MQVRVFRPITRQLIPSGSNFRSGSLRVLNPGRTGNWLSSLYVNIGSLKVLLKTKSEQTKWKRKPYKNKQDVYNIIYQLLTHVSRESHEDLCPSQQNYRPGEEERVKIIPHGRPDCCSFHHVHPLTRGTDYFPRSL